MRAFRPALLAAAFLIGGAAHAASSTPWSDATALLQSVVRDVEAKGLAAMADKVAAIESAVAGAAAAHAVAEQQGIYLTDGGAETIGAMALGAQAHPKMTVTAIDDPYPTLAFFLGSYYDEMNQPGEALRVLDAGIAIPRPIPGTELDEHRPLLFVERGAALTALNRPAESLASYDKALSLAKEGDTIRAPILRGRGFCLTELGRLDEAEQAYKDSLKIDPDNQIALRELHYIDQLRHGAKSGKPELTRPGADGK